MQVLSMLNELPAPAWIRIVTIALRLLPALIVFSMTMHKLWPDLEILGVVEKARPRLTDDPYPNPLEDHDAPNNF